LNLEEQFNIYRIVDFINGSSTGLASILEEIRVGDSQRDASVKSKCRDRAAISLQLYLVMRKNIKMELLLGKRLTVSNNGWLEIKEGCVLKSVGSRKIFP